MLQSVDLQIQYGIASSSTLTVLAALFTEDNDDEDDDLFIDELDGGGGRSDLIKSVNLKPLGSFLESLKKIFFTGLFLDLSWCFCLLRDSSIIFYHIIY